MNREAIFHNPVSNYAFPISYEKFKVRLRAGKGDLDRVTLVIGNNYLWHTRKEVPMEVEGSDELFDYYSYVYLRMGIFAFTCPYTWLTQTILRNFFEKIKKNFLKRWS